MAAWPCSPGLSVSCGWRVSFGEAVESVRTFFIGSRGPPEPCAHGRYPSLPGSPTCPVAIRTPGTRVHRWDEETFVSVFARIPVSCARQLNKVAGSACGKRPALASPPPLSHPRPAHDQDDRDSTSRPRLHRKTDHANSVPSARTCRDSPRPPPYFPQSASAITMRERKPITEGTQRRSRQSVIGEGAELGGDACWPRRRRSAGRSRCACRRLAWRAGGVAGGQGAAAQAGQRVGLVPGAADLAGQVQGLLVTRLAWSRSPRTRCSVPVSLSASASAAPVAEVAGDAQRLLQRSRPRPGSRRSAAARPPGR